ncbi:MAG: VWA domain-containing protein [Oscillospiraceae bacterium]|nr:VWA domain-containing protein [Oscillospiraceae bacterium]
MIDQAEDAEITDREVVFDAESFSIYCVVYTVDIVYEVDGVEYTASMPGAEVILLSNVINELGIVKSAAETDDFISKVADVTSSNNEIVEVTPVYGDWAFRPLKDTAEAETVTVSMKDGAIFTIQVQAHGSTEASTENTVIRTVDDRFLPEAATAYSEILTEAAGDEAVAAVRESTDSSADGTNWQVFSIGLNDINAEEYTEGFEVEVTLDQELVGTDFRLYQVQDGVATELSDTLKLEAETDENDVQTVSGFSFSTESFANFVLSYTVDFEYSVNGKMYQFSLPGGGFVSFTDLVEVLGIVGDTYNEGNDAEIEEQITDGVLDVTASDAVKKFVANVESVEFSNPELVWVGKVDTVTTVGELKATNGLECEYSAELTEEQIAEINAQTVEAGDWALISMLPFSSEEELTVTMKDGEVFTIKVKDAQITTHVLTADGIGYTITITYDEAAGIPNGSELTAREITPNEDIYQDYWDAAEEQLRDENDTAGISGARFFDISIVSNGQKVEPKTAVEVKITQDEPVELAEDEDLRIVHFMEVGIEVIDDVAVNETATEITYMQDSFSVIGEVSVTNSSGWPVVNGQYVLVFQDTANSKYYALGKDGTLREVKVAGETIVFLGEGTTDVSYLDDYAWYLMGSGGDNRTRAYLSTEYYAGSGSGAESGTFIDLNSNTGFSNSARQLFFNTASNMIYNKYYNNEYTFSVTNGVLSKVETSDSKASPILFAQVDGFIANTSESDKFTQIDVDSLVTKFQRQMTQELIADKTAKVQDYSNRIYKIEIGASSGYYEISPSIHLEFVVDASRSMYFPTSLDQAGTLGGNSKSNLATWLNSNGNTNQTYFVISDPNGSATVYTIFRRNNAWYYVDASNYNPPDSEVNEGNPISGWTVNNLDGNIYTTDIIGSSTTTYGTRYKWVSRIEYLKQAVKAAAQVIYAVDANAELGLVTFNASTYDKGIFTKEQAQQFYDALEGISLAGGTNQRDGLQKAIDKFNTDTQRSNHQCIALLITDGAPNWKVNGSQVSNSTAWTEIGQKAASLKALTDGDGTAELYCLGLSLENVGTKSGPPLQVVV